MAINTIEYETLFQRALDETIKEELKTAYMDSNSGQIKYDGGKYVKLPILTVQGLVDYDTENGFNRGGVNFTYQQFEMRYDRGRKFELDELETPETGFVLDATAVLGTFQKDWVVPEIDAFRLSELAQKAIAVGQNKDVTLDEATILAELKTGIKVLKEQGFKDLVIHATSDTIFTLEMAMAGKLTAVTFNNGGVDTRVPAIDAVPLIETPVDRMVSKIVLNTADEGGFTADPTAKGILFLIIAKDAPIAVTKVEGVRIFTPQQNMAKRAWQLDYRRHHDLWVKKSREKAMYVALAPVVTPPIEAKTTTTK